MPVPIASQTDLTAQVYERVRHDVGTTLDQYIVERVAAGHDAVLTRIAIAEVLADLSGAIYGNLWLAEIGLSPATISDEPTLNRACAPTFAFRKELDAMWDEIPHRLQPAVDDVLAGEEGEVGEVDECDK